MFGQELRRRFDERGGEVIRVPVPLSDGTVIIVIVGRPQLISSHTHN